MRSRSGSRSSSCGDHLPALPHHGAVLNQEGPKPTKEQKPRGLREKAKESRAGDGAISPFAPAPARRDARLGEGHRGQTLLAPASKLNRRRSPERAERDYVARSPRNGLPTPRPDQQKSTRGFQISASSQHCPPRDTSKNLTGSVPTRQDGSPRTPPIPLSLYLAHLHPLSTPHHLHLCQVLHCGIEPRLVLGQHGCGQWGKKKKKRAFQPKLPHQLQLAGSHTWLSLPLRVAKPGQGSQDATAPPGTMPGTPSAPFPTSSPDTYWFLSSTRMSSLPSAITATFARAGTGTYGGIKGGTGLEKTEPRMLPDCIIVGPTAPLATQRAAGTTDFEHHPCLGKQELVFQLQNRSGSRERTCAPGQGQARVGPGGP